MKRNSPQVEVDWESSSSRRCEVTSSLTWCSRSCLQLTCYITSNGIIIFSCAGLAEDFTFFHWLLKHLTHRNWTVNTLLFGDHSYSAQICGFYCNNIHIKFTLHATFLQYICFGMIPSLSVTFSSLPSDSRTTYEQLRILRCEIKNS